MKLTTVLLIAAILQVSAAGFAQKITFVKSNSTLKQLFTQINKQTGYSVLLSGTGVKGNQNINANFKNTPLETVLKTVIGNRPVEYIIEEQTIVIRDKEHNIVAAPAPRKAKDTAIVITGQVLSTGNTGLAGATINVTTTNKVAFILTTSADGTFKFLADKGSILNISYIGFETYTTRISTGKLGGIILVPKSNELKEVKIQIGYGTTTKALNTGSVAVVNSVDIEKQPVANVLQALQGMVPGLTVSQTSGFASASFNIKLRGQNSLTTNSYGVNNLSEPLYILDGVPIISAGNSSDLNVGINKNGFTGPTEGQSPLYGLNPTDIESITVLKDADATAIYGARGANGVILITTKKGKAGPATVTANVYSGVSLQTKKLKLMNTQQYLEMRKRALANDNITPDDFNAYDLRVWDQNKYTDWQKELLGNANTTDAQLSLSGGDIQTTYRVSGGYNRTTPPFKGDYQEQRASGSLALNNVSFNNKLTTTATLNFSSTNSNLPQVDLTKLIFLAPNAPSLTDSQGNLNFTDYSLGGLPYEAIGLKRPYSASTKNFIGNLSLKYQIMAGLAFNTSLGYNLSKQNQLQTAPAGSYDPRYNQFSFSTFGNNDSQSWIIEPNLTYNKSIGRHNVTALLGSTFQDTRIEGNRIDATGYTDDTFLESLAGASNYRVVTNYTDTRFQSVFARINYNFDEKYIINLNGRRDGSSRFGNNRKFGNFGSVGAAWIFSKEDFMQGTSGFLSFGKIRGSYGLVGGDNLTDYQYLSSFVNGSYPYQGTPAYQLSRLGNDLFSWTTNKKLEAAIALGFLNGRINTEFSWYRNRSGNQLVSYPLSSVTGFTAVIANLPALVQNQGWELTLQSQNFRTKDFSWATSFNISHNRNKLLAFPGLATSSYAGKYAIGRSINSVGISKYTGVDAATGLYTFADINGDGSVDLYGDTDHVFEDTTPAFFGGINNTIGYQDFQLSFLFNFTKQKSILRLSNVAAGGINAGLGNQLILSEQLTGKPALENLTTNIYRADLFAYNNSDAVFVDASYIRLQNLSFAYNLPQGVTKRAGIKNMKLYLQGQNLLTVTGFKGTDPESPQSFSLPPRKIITAGIQLTF
ncbi:SusC/RagA family TonB-linked outer membrane protein [Mucilaginibacter phyllosphaerae]|nr:SusC/RagA family TonB-linked outer membrane protein [Mucilaginibacter phyllosphaerae]